MTVLQRTIAVEAGAGASPFDRLSDDLKQSAAQWAGLRTDDDRLDDWPMVDLRLNGKHIWAKWWRSEHVPPHRMITVSLEETRDGVEWKALIKLGAVDNDRVLVFDTRNIRPMQPQLPVEQMPRLLDFLVNYLCTDEDGLLTNRPYVLHKKRVLDFLRFLENPPVERRLPIVLISTTNDERRHLVDQRDLALRLQGLAHVVILNQHAAWWADDLPLAHKCFDGAVRVYLPGYTSDDPSAVHRWWHKDRFKPDVLAESTDEIVRFVVEKTALRFRIHSIFPQLQRELNEVRRSAAIQRQAAAIRQALKVENEALFDEFYAEYEKLQHDRDYWEAEARRLDDELDAVRYQVNQQWDKTELLPKTIVESPRLLLSAQAQRVFAELVDSEQGIVRKTIFSKLMQESLRKSQSEVVSTGQDRAYCIYPRKKSASGRRVIYVLEGVDIKVCELFVNHDAYEQARDAGIDLTRYTEFASFDLLDSKE